jgi:hypothetical protein
LESLIRLEKPRQFLASKMAYLVKTYPDKYVAIADEKVLFAEGDLTKLLSEVRGKLGDTKGVLIDYISAKQASSFF